jgi:hypothetical protein
MQSSGFLLQQTRRFHRSYQRYSGGRWAIQRSVQRFFDIVETDSAWQEHFKRVRRSKMPVYEQRVTSSDRLLIHWDSGQFTLVDVGPHDVTERFGELKDSKQLEVVTDVEPVFEWFLPGAPPDPLFRDVEGQGRHLFEGEGSPSWMLYLDDEQDRVKFEILELLESFTKPGTVVWLVGGAGTGKTSVLVNLLADATEYTGKEVYWASPKSVTDFLTSMGTAVRSRQRKMEAIPPGSIVLVDDPTNMSELREWRDWADEQQLAAVVIGFDPLQFREKDVAEWLAKDTSVGVTFQCELHRCYRQAGNVANFAVETSRRVLEGSSYRIDPERISQHRANMEPWVALCLDTIETADSEGRIKIYDDAGASEWQHEVARLLGRDDLWRGWPPLLVLRDDDAGVSLPSRWRQQLKDAGVSTRVKDLSDIQDIRGQEFQEVWILLSPEFRRKVDRGAAGLNGRDWAYLRGLHTAFSRAKDCVVVFERGRG